MSHALACVTLKSKYPGTISQPKVEIVQRLGCKIEQKELFIQGVPHQKSQRHPKKKRGGLKTVIHTYNRLQALTLGQLARIYDGVRVRDPLFCDVRTSEVNREVGFTSRACD